MSSHQLLPLEKLGEEFSKSRGWGHDKERIGNLKRKEKWNWAWAWWLLGTALHIAMLLPWLRLKPEYIVNRVVAYLRDLFRQSPEKALAQETVTCVDWLGSAPSAVCAPSCPTGTHPGSSHLPRSENRLALDFLWSWFTLSFMVSLRVISPNISFQIVQWSGPFLLLLNICQMCTAAWKMERLGKSVMSISLFPFYFSFSEPFSLEKEEDKECSLHSTVCNSLTKSPSSKKIKIRKRAHSIT